ncbi:actin filament-associated protein 1-like [Epinephelus moara]|uniref:actin filament-associated protein 1-like n=1 Tax=Epinephelus moara TaxID=300413 RepID=UPI00214F327D|nr:actin filament-associated protein 1-like [Epinephelus moara]
MISKATRLQTKKDDRARSNTEKNYAEALAAPSQRKKPNKASTGVFLSNRYETSEEDEVTIKSMRETTDLSVDKTKFNNNILECKYKEDELEQYSRKENIRINGMEEQTSVFFRVLTKMDHVLQVNPCRSDSDNLFEPGDPLTLSQQSASSSEGMGRWLGILLAETGSTTDPATLHYDYIDVETTANVIQLAKQSFCFTSKRAVSPNPYLDNPVNGYACPTGVALHYDDVPINGTDPEVQYSSTITVECQLKQELHYENADLCEHLPSPKLDTRYPPKPSFACTSLSTTSASHYNTPVSKISSKFLNADNKTKATVQLKGKKGTGANGVASKQKTEPKNQPKKNGVNGTNGTTSMRRNSSNADQCKYGKNRVEADAKRLQAKEEELMKKKQEIRNHLTQLKKERRDLRTAVEAAVGKRSHASLSERLKKVEQDCKQREEERVNLELELTEVKESLKKALSGGVTLGLTIEPKASSSGIQSPAMLRRNLDSSPFSSCDTSDTESCSGPLPVNSASLLRRQQGSQKVSPVRGHVLRKAKEWEQKTGT